MASFRSAAPSARRSAEAAASSSSRRTTATEEAEPIPPPPPPPAALRPPLPPLVPVSDGGGAWAVVGTCAALVAYGLLQERVMSCGFGPERRERFVYAVFLVAANRLAAIAAVLALHVLRSARLALAITASGAATDDGDKVRSLSSSSSSRRALIAAAAIAERTRRFFAALVPLLAPPKPAAPLSCYARVALSNALATLSQYEALRHVSFIAASLAKTAKALPVLLWANVSLLSGRGRGQRRHTAREACVAVALALGCALFALGERGGGGAAGAGAVATTTTALPAGGLLLLGVYLAADGWTSTEQERLYGRYGPASGGAMDEGDQLLHTSACSALLSVAAAVLSGQLLPASRFLRAHGDAALAVAGLSAASAATQLMIGGVVRRHGALVFAQMMTSRQLASVLLSAAVFRHALAPAQWLGLAVAFGALFCRKKGGVGDGGGNGAAVARRSAGGGATVLHAAGAAAAAERRPASHHHHHHHHHQAAAELVGVVVIGAARPQSCCGAAAADEERARSSLLLPITVRAS